MKLADFLSDKSKQALNEIRKSYSKEDSIGEVDRNNLKLVDYSFANNGDEQSKKISKAARNFDRRIEWQAKKKKKAELRQRLREKKEAYILAKETEKIKQQLTVYSIEQVNWDHLIVFICKEYYLLIIKNSCNKRMSKYYVKTKKFILISKKNYFTVFSDMVMKHEYNKIIYKQLDNFTNNLRIIRQFKFICYIV